MGVIWKCQADSVLYPFGRELLDRGYTLNREEALLIIATFDGICLIFVLWVVCKMVSMNNERYEEMQESTL